MYHCQCEACGRGDETLVEALDALAIAIVDPLWQQAVKRQERGDE